MKKIMKKLKFFNNSKEKFVRTQEDLNREFIIGALYPNIKREQKNLISHSISI